MENSKVGNSRRSWNNGGFKTKRLQTKIVWLMHQTVANILRRRFKHSPPLLLPSSKEGSNRHENRQSMCFKPLLDNMDSSWTTSGDPDTDNSKIGTNNRWPRPNCAHWNKDPNPVKSMLEHSEEWSCPTNAYNPSTGRDGTQKKEEKKTNVARHLCNCQEASPL